MNCQNNKDLHKKKESTQKTVNKNPQTNPLISLGVNLLPNNICSSRTTNCVVCMCCAAAFVLSIYMLWLGLVLGINFFFGESSY